jgi:hypothetical protein
MGNEMGDLLCIKILNTCFKPGGGRNQNFLEVIYIIDLKKVKQNCKTLSN